jgi:hypothetical protein
MNTNKGKNNNITTNFKGTTGVNKNDVEDSTIVTNFPEDNKKKPGLVLPADETLCFISHCTLNSHPEAHVTDTTNARLAENI